MTTQRRRGRYGEQHPRHRFSDRQVAEIRRLREEEGWPYRRIAKEFGLSISHCYRLCSYYARNHALVAPD